MIEDQTDDLLNEHQRRALSTRLAMLDRFFYDVEQLIRADSLRGEMFEVINDLTAEQKKKLEALMNEGRREIRLSREYFSLEVRREYAHRVMASHLSIFWTILEDTRAAKLEGFGGVSPRLEEDLDPRIENLVRIVNLMKFVITAENA